MNKKMYPSECGRTLECILRLSVLDFFNLHASSKIYETIRHVQ